MSSISKTDQLSARVSVKVPQPDSLVEVRVTPPDSNFQVKVSPGDDVIELLIRPGASMVEVRISPPGSDDRLDDEFDQDRVEEALDGASTEKEVVPGVSQAEFAAMVEEEESAEAKKLLDQMAEAEEVAGQNRLSPEYQLPEEVKQILEADPDDEVELNRLDEVLALDETPVGVETAPEEPEALELSPEQAAEILPSAPEAILEAEAGEMDDEAAVAGPAPDELLGESGPSLAEAEDQEPSAVAGPLPGDLAEVPARFETGEVAADKFTQSAMAEPDGFDLPDSEEPDAEETVQIAVPAESSAVEPDEFGDLQVKEESSADEEAQTAVPAESSAVEPDEFDLPDTKEPAADETAKATDPAELSALEPHEFNLDDVSPAVSPAGVVEFDAAGLDNSLGHLTLENQEAGAEEGAAPEAAPALAKPSASRTMEWVPVNPNGTPMDEDEPIAPEVIGAAALDALARLNMAVREEHAAIEAAKQPVERSRPGETTAAATSAASSFFASADSTFTSADSTIMVEMYDDYEPGPNPAGTMTPPPEDELMDLSQVEKDDDLAIDPIDVDGLGELDLEKSHFAETKNGRSSIKARPMIQVIPGNTVVPE